MLRNGYENILKWGKLIAFTGFIQAFIQLLGLLSGFLIIRMLSTKEYAFYTLANTMLGTMTVLADGGIASGVMVEGGKVWRDRGKLGIVIATGLKLRNKFAIISIFISMPILFCLLMKHGAGFFQSLLIMLSLIPAFFAALSDSLLEISSKLHQDLSKLQKNQVYTVIGRFVMLTGSIVIFPWTFIALLGNGIPRIIANIPLKKISDIYADKTQKASSNVEKAIVSIVKKSLPGAIYYCLSSQITLWLISVFGSTQSIAHIGALGRLAAVMTVFTVLFNILIVPRFARLEDNKRVLVSRFILIEVFLFIIGLVVIAFVIYLPKQILLVLGNDYSNLSAELTLIAVSSILNMILGVTYSALVARGWIIRPIIYISINIAVQLVLIIRMNLSDTQNVLVFSIIDYLISYIIVLFYFVYKIIKLPEANLI
ncbi:polysaccharide biosynthesis protein [Mucilaginibacter sp. UYCu711]|uniref:polysaccharide biosynthesis protein n=1 Tax=Mucilaginibacter sp. UYCu711 TaxID=3156339 RepID=UPI003D1EFACD